MKKDKYFIENKNSEYISKVTRKCKCGHCVQIFSRYRREICSNCGNIVFLSEKDRLKFYLKRRGIL